MSSRNDVPKWVGIVLLLLAALPPILTEIYNSTFCSSLCSVGVGYISLFGMLLAMMGLLLPLLGVKYRKNPRRSDRIQDIALGVVCTTVGSILFFVGWRQDPLLQFAQLLLI